MVAKRSTSRVVQMPWCVPPASGCESSREADQSCAATRRNDGLPAAGVKMTRRPQVRRTPFPPGCLPSLPLNACWGIRADPVKRYTSAMPARNTTAVSRAKRDDCRKDETRDASQDACEADVGLRASVDVALSMDTAMVDVNAVRVAVPFFAVLLSTRTIAVSSQWPRSPPSIALRNSRDM